MIPSLDTRPSTLAPRPPGRLDGWEARLNHVVEAARREPYELGHHDCFRVACAVIEALTGIDRWPAFSGYRTKREALVRIAQHGSTFETAGDWFFSGPRIDLKHAQRGDIVAVATADGEKHLAVHLGDRVALMAAAGLQLIPLSGVLVADCRLLCAWKVG